MVIGLLYTPPLLLGTLFLNRFALLILSLLSDPELKLTFSVLSLNSLNLSVFICISHPFISCIVDEWGLCLLSTFCNCNWLCVHLEKLHEINTHYYYILGGCPFNGPLSGTKYPTLAASPIQNASTPKSSLPFSKHRSCALLCAGFSRTLHRVSYFVYF